MRIVLSVVARHRKWQSDTTALSCVEIIYARVHIMEWREKETRRGRKGGKN